MNSNRLSIVKSGIQKGFSLIELLFIVILLSISSVSLVSMFGQLGSNLGLNHDINASAQMAQECAEYLLVQRRENGYAAVAVGAVEDCSAISNFNTNVLIAEPDAHR